MDFQKGDLVVAVNNLPLQGNSIAPPLELGTKYVVIAVILDKAGNQHLDVGLYSEWNYIRSYETGELLPGGDTVHWCHPSRFELL